MADDIVHAGKVCTICGLWKELDLFSASAAGINGRSSACKTCRNAKARERYAADPHVFRERSAKNRLSDPEKWAASKERARQKKLEYYHARSRAHYAKNRESIREKQAEYRDANREKINEANRLYGKTNRTELSRKEREYRNNNLLRRLASNARSRINIAIRKGGYTKQARRTHEIVGCDWPQLKLHIERQFTRGMSWENRSEWHIDHIVPLSSASGEDELLRLCHFTNMRPVWAEENMRKHAKRTLLI